MIPVISHIFYPKQVLLYTVLGRMDKRFVMMNLESKWYHCQDFIISHYTSWVPLNAILQAFYFSQFEQQFCYDTVKISHYFTSYKSTKAFWWKIYLLVIIQKILNFTIKTWKIHLIAFPPLTCFNYQKFIFNHGVLYFGWPDHVVSVFYLQQYIFHGLFSIN